MGAFGAAWLLVVAVGRPGWSSLAHGRNIRLGPVRMSTSPPPFLESFESVAETFAQELGVEVLHVEWVRSVLRVNVSAEAASDDIQRLSQKLSAWLDDVESSMDVTTFDLEVSTPGVSNNLSSDKDFAAFEGFPVTVTLAGEFKGKSKFEGTLHKRDEEFVSLNQHGRIVCIPRSLVDAVALPKAKDGDRL